MTKKRGIAVKKAIVMLFLIFFSIAFGAESNSVYPHFSSVELDSLRTQNARAYKRVLHYQTQLEKLAKLPQDEQLKRLNLYLNGLLSQYDDITNATPEHWATPKEFLRVGFGDCEDYALIKYYSLIRLGFDAKKLSLVIVKEKFRGGDHMVLAYFDKPKKPPLILDNLSFKVLRLDKRVDLEARFFLNASGVYTIDEGYTLNKVAHNSKEFEEVQRRVGKNL